MEFWLGITIGFIVGTYVAALVATWFVRSMLVTEQIQPVEYDEQDLRGMEPIYVNADDDDVEDEEDEPQMGPIGFRYYPPRRDWTGVDAMGEPGQVIPWE